MSMVKSLFATTMLVLLWCGSVTSQAASVSLVFADENVRSDGLPSDLIGELLTVSLELTNGEQGIIDWASVTGSMSFNWGAYSANFDNPFVEREIIESGVSQSSFSLLSSNSSAPVVDLSIRSGDGRALSTVADLSAAAASGVLVVGYDLDLSSFEGGPEGAYEGVFTVSEVPLPAAMWLFGSGLLGFVAVSRRRHRRA